MNQFPALGIDIAALACEVDLLLNEAVDHKQDLGGVNWGDLGIADIQYRLSMLHPEDGPGCMVIIEKAYPECGLAGWLFERLDKVKFPNVYFECEW